ncbi:Crp/Fnr family transcriptional regulator [Clostridium baratii]|uniref:Crp/Fnr family transcriptional regulator n=1 Tax=Clostridium baratii TaxID=1561 RepID=UPI0028FF6EF5|nr:Crp/Fnr family transcriptional regulator [Clostridium baratii]MDU1055047.1 Crp/Fnr family transcriptional regulator [Clostridium baratii]
MIKSTTKELMDKLVPLIKKKICIKKNKIVLEQNEFSDSTYILLSGKVKVTHLLHDSNELILTIYSGKNIMLKPYNKYQTFVNLFRVETIEDSIFGVIPTKEIEKDDKLRSLILTYYDLFFQKTYLQMRDLLCNNKEKSLYSVLIRLSNSYGIQTDDGIKINLKISNKDLSEFTGASYETISRLLSKIRKKNLIEIKGGFITIKDINYMKDELNCKDCNEELCIF